MVSFKVYVEGGGNTKELKARCRRGFRSFFEKANLAGRLPRIIACGGRQNTFNRFSTAWRAKNTEDVILLLVDSEDPVQKIDGPCHHLNTRDGWNHPNGVTDEYIHLMVQCMESWFIADKDCLNAYFGSGFAHKSLPATSSVEDIAKADVFLGLRNASRKSNRGVYNKGSHSYRILEQIDTSKVMDSSPYAKRLIETLWKKAPK